MSELNPCPKLSLTVSEDCISKQAVIDYLNKLLDGRFDAVKGAMIQGIRDNIRRLPPVTPTERTGEWIRKYCFQEWKCSECEYEIDGKTNYCPNCGAKMRDEEK